jgi:hypothetical protein
MTDDVAHLADLFFHFVEVARHSKFGPFASVFVLLAIAGRNAGLKGRG